MALFLVERYLPNLDEERLERLGARLHEVAGSRWIGSLGLTGDDLSLCIFNANTITEVRTLNDRGAAPYETIIPIIAAPQNRFSPGLALPDAPGDGRRWSASV